METSSGMVFLESLWSEISWEGTKCCQCGLEISADTVLARTFALQGKTVTDERPYIQMIEVPKFSEVILVYHRHLECLLNFARYVAISHVWDPGVAELEYQESEAQASVDYVADLVREGPVRIYLGLAASLIEHFEVWHDYISVPQWQPGVKGKIIEAIPQIYHQACPTVAFLSDVDIECFNAMRKGKSVDEICRGISDICNTKYFSRVWTGMELTQSGELRAMLKGYTLVSSDQANQSFLDEIHYAWDLQVTKQGSPHRIEHMVGIGENLVPWQLGPLPEIRQQNLQGQKTAFAKTYLMLARRCVTRPRDFFTVFSAR
jgi:hypothetical protein